MTNRDTMTRRRLFNSVGAAALAATIPAHADETRVITLGILSDFSGPYSSWGGNGSILAARMAAEEFAQSHPGFPFQVKITSADFALKSDLKVTITRQWIEQSVNAILDVPHSASALAVAGLVKGTKTAALFTAAASDDLVTKNCSPNVVHWTFDQYSVAAPTFQALAKGGTWFFVLQDSLPGQAFEGIANRAILGTGGRVLGTKSYARTSGGQIHYAEAGEGPPLVEPGSLRSFCDLLVSELQDRGAYKTQYAAGSMREKLFPGTHGRVKATHPAARSAAAA